MRPTRKNLDQREHQAAMHRKWNEPRVWQIKCPACEHTGTVFMTLRRLRQVNLKCSECAKAAAAGSDQQPVQPS
jgi:ribosomal protein S27E